MRALLSVTKRHMCLPPHLSRLAYYWRQESLCTPSRLHYKYYNGDSKDVSCSSANKICSQGLEKEVVFVPLRDRPRLEPLLGAKLRLHSVVAVEGHEGNGRRQIPLRRAGFFAEPALRLQHETLDVNAGICAFAGCVGLGGVRAFCRGRVAG